jgi:hypothetical protein
MKKCCTYLSLAIVFSLIDQSCKDKITDPIQTVADSLLTVEGVIEDMILPGDAPLHGTEGLSWGDGGGGATLPLPCPAKNYKGEWFEAMTCWGQAYIARTGNTATNVRVQIRNVKTKLLKKNGKWIIVQSGNILGAAFVESFANNENKPADIRNESANGGGVSVIVGIGDYAGYNFHWWLGPRAAVDVNDIVGVFTTCQARLIVDNPDLPDDRANSKTLLDMGADWWLNMTTGWLPGWSANSGIGGGRMKWVKNDWQHFSMCTLSPEQIRANPPF